MRRLVRGDVVLKKRLSPRADGYLLAFPLHHLVPYRHATRCFTGDQFYPFASAHKSLAPNPDPLVKEFIWRRETHLCILFARHIQQKYV